MRIEDSDVIRIVETFNKKSNKVKTIKNKPTKKVTNRNEYQLSKKSQEFLDSIKPFFGVLESDFIEERLKDLPEKTQSDMVWRILHYLISDEYLPTGKTEVDIRLSEILQVLPFFCVFAFRTLRKAKCEKPETTSKKNEICS